MKSNIILLILVVFSLKVSAAHPPILRFDGMKGQVKSVTLIKHSVSMDNGRPGKGQPFMTTVSHFNPEGLMTHQELLDGEGSTLSATDYSYTDGKQTRIEMRTPHAEGVFIQELQSDANNEKVWIAGTSDDDQEPVHIVVRFDPVENSCSWYAVIAGEAVFDHKEVYDERGNSIEYHFGDGEMATIRKNTYDEDNNILRQSNKTGKQQMILTYTYPRTDPVGNWIEQHERNSTGYVVSINERKIEYFSIDNLD